jgi:hypothetical protein
LGKRTLVAVAKVSQAQISRLPLRTNILRNRERERECDIFGSQKTPEDMKLHPAVTQSVSRVSMQRKYLRCLYNRSSIIMGKAG